MAKKNKQWYYQYYKISPNGIITVLPQWFPEGKRPVQIYFIRDEKSKRRFKEVEDEREC